VNGAAKRWRLAAATLAVGVALGLGAAELALRLAGRAPWHPLPPRPNEPVMFEPDPELGWRSRPGRLDVPASEAGAPPVRLTNLPDGSRTTGPGPEAPAPRLALLGCSFVQGWGVSDEETFAFALQRRWPELRVANFGTGGYGTLQSLLLLERLLAGPDPPRAVVYGLVFLHEDRNVATADWLYSLALTASRGNGRTPFASLSAGGELRLHPPAAYPLWPLHERLAVVAFAQDLAARASARRRSGQARAVTQRLVLELAAASRRRGAAFAVALLWMDDAARAEYSEFLRRSRITGLDCVRDLPLERRVPGDGHPNAEQHALWAACVGDGVEQLRLAGWFSAEPGPTAR
jgi:hypothetical protein